MNAGMESRDANRQPSDRSDPATPGRPERRDARPTGTPLQDPSARIGTGPSIGAIVPAFDAEPYIGRCLEGLLDAGFAPHEIVVVDDGSTDRTAAIAADHSVRIVRLPGNSGASAARNAGGRAAGAEILFFVDADVVAAPDVRTVLAAFFAEYPNHAAVFGTYDDAPSCAHRTSRIRNLLHRHTHLLGAGEAVTFWTGCGAVRKADFDALDGFDTDCRMMEDVEFGIRLAARGRPIRLDPRLQGKHMKGWSLPAMARTDLFDRAIPWARILLDAEARALPRTLNVGRTGQISVASVGLSLLSPLVALVAPGWALACLSACLGVLIVANRVFLARLWSDDGPIDAVAAIGVLWVHYLCGGLGYAWVRVMG